MKTLGAIGCLILLAGCAHLGADVYVFNKTNLTCLDTNKTAADKTSADEPAGQSGTSTKSNPIPKLLYKKLTQKGTLKSLDEQRFIASFEDPAVKNTFMRAYSKNDSDLKLAWQNKLQDSLKSGTGTEELQSELSKDTNKNIFVSVADNNVQEISAQLQSTYGGNLLEDKWTSVVLYAPDTCWQKTYGTASGLGFFGNSDIAIKMEGPGDFVVKGLRLDASKMTQALFKGLNQGLMLLATAYGVPMPKMGSGATQSTDVGSMYEEIAGVEQQAIDSRFSVRQSKGRTLRLFEEVIAQRTALESEDAWQSALGNMKTAVTNYKTLTESAK